MSWFFKVFFDKYSRISEICSCNRLCGFDCTHEFFFFINCTHTNTSTSSRSFYNYWISDLSGYFFCFFNLNYTFRSSFNNWYASFFHQSFRCDFISHFMDNFSTRSYKFYSIFFTFFSEFRVLC